MAKIRNMVIYVPSQTKAQNLESEYQWMGRDTKLVMDQSLGYRLTVFAVPRKNKRKARLDAKRKAQREKLYPDY